MTHPLARAASEGERQASLMPGLRALDTILVADRAAWAAVPPGAVGEAAARSDAAMLWIAGRDPIEWAQGDRRLTCPPGGAILCDLADGAGGVTGGGDGIVLILRERVTPTLTTVGATARVLSPSRPVQALANLAAAWLMSGARLSAGQERLAGRAVGELVAAALLPLAPAVGERRKTSLLDRVVGYIDGHYAEDIDAPAVCEALSCSRSALYRATRPAGGVIALVKQRRLTAVYDRLCDPAETASVAELARVSGFDDPSQFSRSFKRRYGRTAGAVRAAHRPAA